MFLVNLLFGLMTRAGATELLTVVLIRTIADATVGGAPQRSVSHFNHDKKRILIMAQSNQATQPIFGKPAVVPASTAPAANQNRGNGNRGYVPDADFVAADLYLNAGIGAMIPQAEGEEPMLSFISLPKGQALDTMERTDGKTDAYAARNELLECLLSAPRVKALQPGEHTFLMPLVAGQMTIQVLRRRDPNAPIAGPSPITSAIKAMFV